MVLFTRIIESRNGLEGTLKTIQFQPRAVDRDSTPPDQLPRSPSSLALSTSRHGAPTAPLGQAVPGPHCLNSNFFLVSKPTLFHFLIDISKFKLMIFSKINVTYSLVIEVPYISHTVLYACSLCVLIRCKNSLSSIGRGNVVCVHRITSHTLRAFFFNMLECTWEVYFKRCVMKILMVAEGARRKIDFAPFCAPPTSVPHQS